MSASTQSILGGLILLASSTAFGGGITHSTPVTDFANLPALAQDEAYVLVNLEVRGTKRRAIEGMTLTNSETGARISIPHSATQPQLLRVKAGTFVPEAAAISTNRNTSQLAPLKTRSEVSGIVIEPQTITYIGDFVVTHGRQLMVNGSKIAVSATSYGVNYDPNRLDRAATELGLPSVYAPSISATNGIQLKARWDLTADGAIAGLIY